MPGGVRGAAEGDDHYERAGPAGADRGRAPVEAVVDRLHDGGPRGSPLGRDGGDPVRVRRDGILRAVDRPGDRRRRGERPGGDAGREDAESRWA